MIRENLLAKIVANSAPHVRAGETVRLAIQGQAGMQPKVVAVTDETVYVLHGSRWSNVGVKSVEATLPRGTPIAASAHSGGRVYLVLGQLRIAVNIGNEHDVERLVQAINEPGPIP